VVCVYMCVSLVAETAWCCYVLLLLAQHTHTMCCTGPPLMSCGQLMTWVVNHHVQGVAMPPTTPAGTPIHSPRHTCRH
jgi:hypothetical protein